MCVFGRVFHQEYTKDKVLAAMHLKRQTTPATVVTACRIATAPRPNAARSSGLIKRRGALRVGYLRDSLPYAFFNAAGELVGLDVELAHHLAAELQVPLEFVPIDRERMVEQVNSGDCDILMSGVAITTMRASQMVFSSDYVDETMAFVVPDSARGDYRVVAAAREADRRCGSESRACRTTSRSSTSVCRRPTCSSFTVLWTSSGSTSGRARRDGVPGRARFRVDADVSKFSVVIPEPDPVKVPLAYPIGQQRSGVCDVREYLD